MNTEPNVEKESASASGASGASAAGTSERKTELTIPALTVLYQQMQPRDTRASDNVGAVTAKDICNQVCILDKLQNAIEKIPPNAQGAPLKDVLALGTFEVVFTEQEFFTIKRFYQTEGRAWAGDHVRLLAVKELIEVFI